MKRISLQKVLSLALVLVLLVSLLSGCVPSVPQKPEEPKETQGTQQSQEQQGTQPPEDPQPLQPMSFEFTLVDRDLDEALSLIEQLETHIDNKDNAQIISTSEVLDEKMNYIYHQFQVARVKYYSDLKDDDADENYEDSEEIYMEAREELVRVLKKLYATDLEAKATVFEDWTEQDFKALEAINEEVIRLEQERNDLVRDYLQLDGLDSKAWSTAMETLFFEFVSKGQRLAELYGYDNYYDYAAKELYMREYTKEQRAAFRQNVKDRLIPFYIELVDFYRQKSKSLTTAQKTLLSSLRNDSCQPANEYLTGYINSYPEEMKTVMNHLFDRNALVYSTSDNAHSAAYTSYSDYCEQPFVFLGNGMQNLLTLVHEMGHYVSFYHFTELTLPYDTAEVHSQGNEWLLLYYLDGKIDDDVYEMFLLDRLLTGLDIAIISTIVDEYEERIYTGNITSPQQFRAVMESVLEEYKEVEQLYGADVVYNYAQRVTLESPVYYLSYATSELAAMTFYTVAVEDGYDEAQKIYIDLCLETPVGDSFFDTLSDVGLPDPFQPITVVRMTEAFVDVIRENALPPAA